MPSPKLSELPPPPREKVGWPWDSQLPSVPETMKSGCERPAISIVTPSYNQGKYIEETIRSVLMQGYPNIEYIVIDGGSTDDTLEIIQRYEPWLTYWVSEADAGQAEAIAKGFKQATGQLFAWQNSDDFYEPDAFERVADFFSGAPDIVFANGDVNLVGQDGRFVRRIYAMRPSHFFAANYGQHGWPQQGCFWRKSTYEDVGGVDPSLQFCMDKDLFIRLVGAGRGRRIPGAPLANFREHPEAKSTILNDVAQQETACIIDRYGDEKWTSHPRALQTLWWLYRKQAAIRLRIKQYVGTEL